eukprot:SAG31_NODE_8536_length_1434_cov_1.439700_4_plen_85_part_00
MEYRYALLFSIQRILSIFFKKKKADTDMDTAAGDNDTKFSTKFEILEGSRSPKIKILSISVLVHTPVVGYLDTGRVPSTCTVLE